MAVKIRLARCGRRHLAEYDIVVADARSPRDGRFIEKIGNYNPNAAPATVKLNEASALKWLFQGAQPTDTVKTLLSKQGIMLKKHLQIGVMKGAITQEQANQKFTNWQADRLKKLAAHL
ncbi:30S ribosomal protein S16 [Cardinium endosymbiont cEper1 of Encarsia pergandiella]|uniref:30S ribosomal protein S16 n=1 Tax=Cardinium endosymbiont of Encarsia pergandiella TaxID=249402 RepID=UPI00027EA299|nr:30S ribosomal protein S16 [Cardinium endosymbiont of Encarsia pergandiella]CCM10203.1 30S ribosomal protein S16 [Cardinium endosymbiont cEper1 of Encarsia pergandiella]